MPDKKTALVIADFSQNKQAFDHFSPHPGTPEAGSTLGQPLQWRRAFVS